MSRAIDEKVVELRFDNKQFESGVKESLSTLDRLKTVLDKNISSKSLDNVTKAANSMDLSNITKNLESLSSRFSTLGIVGMTVIQNITEGLLGGLSKAVKKTTDSIVSGGIKRAMNIENAHFQLQGLMDDEKEVQAIMADAMDSVDGTAYAYDEAAKAASMFAATGLKSGDEMQRSLKAIAGVAATTNSEYSGIADVFTKISGQGRVMGDDLNRLAVRGLNAAASMTTYMNGVNDGTIEASESIKEYVKEITEGDKITEADLRKMVSESKISFNLFSEAMATTFGDHAKDANETFTGSMANIRAALARTGAMFVTPLVSQNGPFVQFFNAVRVKVNEFNKALGATNGIAERFTTWVNATVTKLTEVVNGFDVAHMYVERYSNGVEKAFETTHIKVQELSDGTSRVIVEDLYTPFGALRDLANSLVNIFKAMVSVAVPIGRAFKDVFAFDVKNLYKAIEGFEKFTEGLVLSEKHSKQVQTLFTGVFKVLESIATITVKVASSITNNIKPVDNLSDKFFNLAEGIGNVLSNFADFLKESETINNVIEGIGLVVGGAVNLIGEAIAFIADAISQISSGSISKVFEGLSSVFDGLKDVAGALVGILAEVFGQITGVEIPIGKVADGLTGKFGELLSGLGDVLKRFAEFLKESEVIRKAIDVLAGVVVILKNTISEAFTSLVDLFKSFSFSGSLEKIIKILERLKTTVSNILPQGIKDAIIHIKDAIVELLEKLGIFDFSAIDADFKSFTDLYKEFVEASSKMEFIKDAFVKFFDFSEETSGINNFKRAGDSFVQWLQKNILPAFDNINVPATLATGGYLYIMFKVAELIGTLAKVMKSGGDILNQIPAVLSSLRKALDSYTKENTVASAESMAKSILMVSAALLMLSVIKPERLWPAIIAIGVIGTALTALALALKQAPKTLPTNIFDVLDTLSKEITKSLNKLATAQVVKQWSKSVFTIAAAVGLVVGEIAAVMYLINTYPKDFGVAVGIVAAITGALITIGTLLTLMATKLKNEMKAFDKFSSGVLKLSAAVLVSVIAIKELMEIQLPNDYETKLKILGGLFAAIGVLILAVAAADRIAGNNHNLGIPIISIVALITASIMSLKTLMGMSIPEDWKEKFDLLEKIFIYVGALVGVVAIASRIGGDKSAKAFNSFIGISALLIASVHALDTLMKMEFSEDWTLKLGVLGLIFAAVGAITVIVGKSSGNGGLKAFGTFLGISVLLGEILVALKVLELYDTKKMYQDVLAVSAILLALSFTLKGAGSISSAGSALAVLSMALVIGAIVTSLMVLSIMSDRALMKGTLSLSTILLILALTFAGAGKISNENTWKSILSMAGLVASITASLMILSISDWPNMLSGAVALSSVLYTLSHAFSNVEKISKESLAAVLLGSIGTIFIGAALWIAANQPWQQILAAGASISACLMSIGVAFGIINSTANSGNFGPAIAEFAAGVIGVIAIGEELSRLANSANWKELLASGVSVSVVLLSMAVTMAICSAVGSLAAPAMIGMALLDAFIVNLSAVMWALGKIPKEHQDIIANGGEVLVSIGKAIGNFAGSIIEGIGHGIAKSLEEIGSSLSVFMENAKPFFDGLKNINSNTLTSAGILAGVVLAIASADLISGISRFVNMFSGRSGMEAFADDLNALGKALTDFDRNTKSINDPERFRIVSESAKYLVDMSKSLPNSGGFLGDILGNNDMDTWGSQLSIMGGNLADFAAKIRNISDEDFVRFKTYAKAVKPLVDMSLQLPISGGLLGQIIGNNDMGTWGRELSLMGGNLAEFAAKIRSINEEDFAKFTRYASSVMPLVEMSQALPNTGGKLGDILGNNDMDTWGKNLSVMGKHIADFSIAIRPIESSDFAKFITFKSSVAHLTDLFTIISIKENLSVKSFTLAVDLIGPSIARFSANIAGVDTTHMISVSNAFKQLISAVESIGEFNGSKNISDFSEALSKLATDGIKTFINEFVVQSVTAVSTITQFLRQNIKVIESFNTEFEKSGINNVKNYTKGLQNGTEINSVVRAARDLVAKAKEAIEKDAKNLDAPGRNCVKEFANGLKNSGAVQSVKSAADEMVKTATNILEKESGKFRESGTEHLTKYADGLKDSRGLYEIKEAAEDLVEAVKDAIEKYTRDFEDLGEDCVEGFINGLESSYMMSKVRRAARRMAEEAYEAAQDELDSHSPSRLFRKLGNYTGEGYKLGIEDTYNDISESAYDMAKSAKSGLDLAMSQITDQVDEIEDLYPVITPMVDLSNIISAASDISSMFNTALGSTISRTSVAGSYVRSGNVSNGVNEIQNGQGNQGNTYNFVQNNTSPKSLSRIEIYRQTRNQFAQFREVVEGV